MSKSDDFVIMMENLVKKAFPQTKALQSQYWNMTLVNGYVNAREKGSETEGEILILMMGSYISGFLIGEGHGEDEIYNTFTDMHIDLRDILGETRRE